MRVSINWLKELVNLNISVNELVKLIPLKTIGIKEETPDYFELDMKGYNRADLLSLRGVAYEVAAITDSKINFSEEKDFIWQSINQDAGARVETKLAPLYCVARIEGLKAGASNPDWVKKLSDCGLRSVNNLADVTNLVMLEFGQPLHAFDAAKVAGRDLIVRTAQKGEQLITLDGRQRTLDDEDLVIADSQKVLGLAGVMGGKNSEATESTTSILLEAAIFDSQTISKTSTRHSLVSDASKRFKHGLTKKRALQALNRAAEMYQQIGGKLTALSIVDNFEDKIVTLPLSVRKTNDLIGVNLSKEQIKEYLEKLNFKVEDKQGELLVTVPYFRLDIEVVEDLIEEVARMYGYEQIPAKELDGPLPEKVDQTLFNFIYDLKKSLADAGLTEVQTYSFFSTDILNNFDWDRKNLVKIANPISAETEYLREDLWPNLVEAAAKNIKKGHKTVAIFELGKTYHPKKDSNPDESYRISLLLSGNFDNPTPALFQLFQKVNQKLNLKIEVGPDQIGIGKSERGEYEQKYFHPTRFANLTKDSKEIGGVAEVHPRFVNKFGVENKVAVLEIELSSISD